MSHGDLNAYRGLDPDTPAWARDLIYEYGLPPDFARSLRYRMQLSEHRFQHQVRDQAQRYCTAAIARAGLGLKQFSELEESHGG